jgi:hypothetical protein
MKSGDEAVKNRAVFVEVVLFQVWYLDFGLVLDMPFTDARHALFLCVHQRMVGHWGSSSIDPCTAY